MAMFYSRRDTISQKVEVGEGGRTYKVAKGDTKLETEIHVANERISYAFLPKSTRMTH